MIPKEKTKKFFKILIFFKKTLEICILMCYNNNRSAKGIKYGSIAQLGEHLPYKQRVTGSSPVVPTSGESPQSISHSTFVECDIFV